MKAESHVKDNFIYVVVGKSENVYQDKIGGPFDAHPDTEPVEAFCSMEAAKDFILSQKLKKTKKVSYGDSYSYKGGFFEMHIEQIPFNNK